jgi:hypothetical protein
VIYYTIIQGVPFFKLTPRNDSVIPYSVAIKVEALLFPVMEDKILNLSPEMGNFELFFVVSLNSWRIFITQHLKYNLAIDILLITSLIIL